MPARMDGPWERLKQREVMGHFWVLDLGRYRETVARLERLGRGKKE